MKHTYFWRIALALSLMLNIHGALAQDTSSVMASAPAAATDDVVLTKDTFEGFNRGAYQFNDGWDQVVFRPIAKTYEKVVPAGTRGCVHGIFENLGTPYTAVNNILQGKFKSAGQDLCRFVINSTVGLGGCFDVASKWNIPKHDEDFGQTLGVWGVPAGPFVMLPALGPSTVRDALAKPVDFLADPIGYIHNIKIRNSTRGLKLIDTRTNLLETLDFADDVAFDKYALIRDAWLQSREAQVRDEDYEPDAKPISSAPAAEVAPAVEEMTKPAASVEVAPMVQSTAVVDELAPFTPETAQTTVVVTAKN